MDPEIKRHFIKGLKEDFRFDGRHLTQFRDVKIETGISRSAEGSARVKIGATELIAGVKMAVETPYLDTPEEGNLMVNAELLPLSSPEFEPGPPGNKAIELARIVDRGIRESKAIDTKKLCIAAGEKVWSVIIDICTVNDAGNLIDAAALASLAALKTTRFPKYDPEKNELDYNERTETPLPILREPIAVTVYKTGEYVYVDPLSEEEEFFDARLTVTCTKEGNVCSLQKGGNMPLTVDEVDRMIGIAIEKSKEMRGHLNNKKL